MIRERPGWTCLFAGAGLLFVGYVLGVATPRPEILAIATSPQTRQLIDVERVRSYGDDRVWSIRYVDPYDQMRIIEVATDSERDRLVEWIVGEPTRMEEATR